MLRFLLLWSLLFPPAVGWANEGDIVREIIVTEYPEDPIWNRFVFRDGDVKREINLLLFDEAVNGSFGRIVTAEISGVHKDGRFQTFEIMSEPERTREGPFENAFTYEVQRLNMGRWAKAKSTFSMTLFSPQKTIHSDEIQVTAIEFKRVLTPIPGLSFDYTTFHRELGEATHEVLKPPREGIQLKQVKDVFKQMKQQRVRARDVYGIWPRLVTIGQPELQVFYFSPLELWHLKHLSKSAHMSRDFPLKHLRFVKLKAAAPHAF